MAGWEMYEEIAIPLPTYVESLVRELKRLSMGVVADLEVMIQKPRPPFAYGRVLVNLLQSTYDADHPNDRERRVQIYATASQDFLQIAQCKDLARMAVQMVEKAWDGARDHEFYEWLRRDGERVVTPAHAGYVDGLLKKAIEGNHDGKEEESPAPR